MPICENGRLVGILTNRDLRFLRDFNIKIKEVMTKDNLITAPQGTTLMRRKKSSAATRSRSCPWWNEQGRLKGLITIKDIEKAVQYPNSARDKNGRLLCAAAIGITSDVLERAAALVKSQVDVLVLDSAHGHSHNIMECIKKVKAAFPMWRWWPAISPPPKLPRR